METFYETYKFLLLELSLEDVVKLLDNEKFKRIFTDTEHLAIKDIMMNIIPNDIHEKDKANALNWLRSSTINDKRNIQYLMRPGGERMSFVSRYLRKYLELFYQMKQQNVVKKFAKYSAIEDYKTFEEFVEDLTQAEGPYREYLAQKQEKSTKGEGQLLVYEDENWQVYFPQTKGAACSLGKGTDWCTAAPGLDYYSEYAKEGQLIIFISKKDPAVKYQLHYASAQYMDASDMDIGNRVNVLNKILKDNIIGSEFEKYLNEYERKEIINLATKTSGFEMIDDNYMFVEGEIDEHEEGGTVYRKDVVNIGTLENENPYSPTYRIDKVFYSDRNAGTPLYSSELDEAVICEYYYYINVDHPDNTKKISQLTVGFDFDPESGREKLIRFGTLQFGGGYNKYPPEKAAEFARYMTLGIEDRV
jgi:hypothetical protein